MENYNYILSRVTVISALLIQLFHLKINKLIYPPTFFIYSVGISIMWYEYYKIDKKLSERVIFKLLTILISLFIGIFSMFY